MQTKRNAHYDKALHVISHYFIQENYGVKKLLDNITYLKCKVCEKYCTLHNFTIYAFAWECVSRWMSNLICAAVYKYLQIIMSAAVQGLP